MLHTSLHRITNGEVTAMLLERMVWYNVIFWFSLFYISEGSSSYLCFPTYMGRIIPQLPPFPLPKTSKLSILERGYLLFMILHPDYILGREGGILQPQFIFFLRQNKSLTLQHRTLSKPLPLVFALSPFKATQSNHRQVY